MHGISLGPADPVFQNVGLDVGRVVPADELRLHLRGAGGIAAPLAWLLSQLPVFSERRQAAARLGGARVLGREDIGAIAPVAAKPASASFSGTGH